MANVKWLMDAAHSEVQFRVRHLMVSWVTGTFQQFEATLETADRDMTTAKVHFNAAVSSIFTRNEQRDAHLRSKDFFDAENHPQLIFDSEKLQHQEGDDYSLTGTLTMRGISRPVTFKVAFGGIINDPRGKVRTGFTVSGTVSRNDFGISFSRLAEAGEALLGDMVTIYANAEFIME